ncbi:unnamed protein product [Anisakis simplex]|uniref:Uncharacterized protein n=1 Tax=Anisakis simplex TaxID=6269 RepID=A0A3P6RDS5_ANISI|nr:unnamed protein product [Anisakis simplex]
MSQSSWLLIYRDVNASRSYALCALLIPLSCMVTSLLIIDFFYHSHNHQQRSRLLQRICHDANEVLGILLIIPLLSIIQVVLLLLRLQYMRLFRIYQNKQHPSEFTAVLSRGCLLQKKVTIYYYFKTKTIKRGNE